MSAQRKKIQFNIGGIAKAPAAAAVSASAEEASGAYSPTRPTTSPERKLAWRKSVTIVHFTITWSWRCFSFVLTLQWQNGYYSFSAQTHY